MRVSLGKLLPFFALTALFLWAAPLYIQKINLVTADLGRHITNGRLIVEAPWAEKLQVLRANLYSYTLPEAPFVNHHWGSGVIFYLVYSLAGFSGLSLLYLILSLSALFLFWRLARQLGGTLAGFLLTLLLAYRAEVRPEVFTYLLSGAFLNILYTRKGLWLLPPLMLLWVNLHIGFIFGFLILGAFWLEEVFRARRGEEKDFILTKILGASLLLGLVNPFGYKLLLYPLTIFNNYGYTIVENQSVRFLESIGFTLGMHFAAVKVVLLAVFATGGWLYYKKFVSLGLLLPTLVTGVLAYAGIRHIEMFALFSLPLLALGLKKIVFDKLDKEAARLVFALALALALVLEWGSVSLAWQGAGLGVSENVLAAAEFVKSSGLKGPIFNNYDVGGYLIFGLYPQERVYVDNRPEAYTESFFADEYIAPQESEAAWQALEKRWGFNAVIFSYRDYTPWAQNFLAERAKDPSWAPVFADGQIVVFAKNNALNAGIIEKFRVE